MFRTISEVELAGSTTPLADCWNSEESLVMVPSPSPIAPQWLKERIAMLPPSLGKGHFGILTSGSTGQPKLVIGSKTRTVQLAKEIHSRQQLEPVEQAILALPLSYSYSLVNQWLWSHVHGRMLVQTRGLSDPASLITTLCDASKGMLCMVGSMLPVLRRFLTEGMDFPGIIRLNFAGGPFPQSELPWLHRIFPNAAIFHNYGCTEALPRLTIRPAEAYADPMILGAPVQGAEFRLDPQGMLQFRSPFAAVAIVDADGYHPIDQEEWIDTGDKAEFLPDGQVRLLGRKSEVFKRHGEKISLSNLAESLRQAWSQELAFYVETAPDGEPGHVLVLAPNATKDDSRNLLLLLRQQYRRPFWPIRIETAPTIPLLGNGKPDLSSLREIPRELLWKQML